MSCFPNNNNNNNNNSRNTELMNRNNNRSDEASTIINDDQFQIINANLSNRDYDRESEYLYNYNNLIIKNKNPGEEEMLRYLFAREYFKLHPNMQDNFLKRMEIDIEIRQSKDKVLEEFIQKTKLRMSEDDIIKGFNRLIEDANRREEAKQRIELYKKKKEEEEIEKLKEEFKKKCNPNKWKELYNNRFGNGYEDIIHRLERKINKQISTPDKIENSAINLYIDKTLQKNKNINNKENNKKLFSAFNSQKEKIINQNINNINLKNQQYKDMFNKAKSKMKRNRSVNNRNKYNNKNKTMNYIINDPNNINENINIRNGKIVNSTFSPAKYLKQYKKNCNLKELGQ